jgi:hypothetical protein
VPRRHHTVLVALIAGGVAVLAVVGVVLWLALGRGAVAGGTAASSAAAAGSAGAGPGGQATGPAGGSGPGAGGATAAGIPPPTVPPTGLGTDRVLNGYAQDCYRGNMVSCDIMYVLADQGTRYSVYGDTCAGRQPQGTEQLCEEAFPG